jgi:hypothetical protein
VGLVPLFLSKDTSYYTLFLRHHTSYGADYAQQQRKPLTINASLFTLVRASVLSMFFLDRQAQRPLVAFLRTQRSYNKRRYAKARVVSRPSFVFGILLSCFLVGAFWGGTNYGLD